MINTNNNGIIHLNQSIIGGSINAKSGEEPTLSYYSEPLGFRDELNMEVDMSKKKIVEIVTDLAESVVKKHLFELVDVEYVKEGPNWYLRIYIDKPGGITIDDCKAVSEEVSDLLDREDPIPQSYFLEVSSPGLERPLKKDSDFEKFKGELVEVKLFKAINGKKIYTGELIGLIDNKIVISQETGETIKFEREEVSLVRRTIIF